MQKIHLGLSKRLRASMWLAVLVAVFGVAAAAQAVLPQQSGLVDLLTQANVRMDGTAAGDRSGSSVGGAGDLNGDGIDDAIVGSPNASNNGRHWSGSAYVVFGRPPMGTLDLNDLAQSGFRIDGAASGDYAGQSVVGAGDVNGDGLADVIVGAPNAENNGRTGSGSAYVVFGKDPADPTLNDPIDLANLGSQGFRIDGAVPDDAAGMAVAGAGDLNDDNLDDVIVGAHGADNNGRTMSGSAYVVFGKGTAGTVDLTTLGGQGFRIDGAAANDRAGNSVAGAGDFNGDERPDALVGAPYADNNARTDSGSSYIVYGFGAPQVTYSPNSIGATVGSPITPVTPTVERTGIAAFGVSPSLPAGLALNPDTGTISGTPSAKQPARTYTVTMTDLAVSATASVSIRVGLPQRDWKNIEEPGGG